MYTVNTEFFLIDKKGNHKLLKSGTKLTTAQYTALNPQKQGKCTFTGSKVYYTMTEALSIGKLYLENDNVAWVTDTWIKQNPNQMHTTSSVNAMVRQFMALDSHHPMDTEWEAKTVTIRAAIALDPDRFFASNEEARDYKLQTQAEQILAEILG